MLSVSCPPYRLDAGTDGDTILPNRIHIQQSQSLESRICERFVSSKYGNEREQVYVPEGQLDELITEATIVEQLPDDYPEKGELVTFILLRAKKTFAITLLTGLRGYELCQAITRFWLYGITDQNLPVRDLGSNPAFANPPWSMWKLQQFGETQWGFLVPIFTANKLVYSLERERILPFVGVDSSIRDGSFGRVYQVKVHKAHQRNPAFMARGEGTPIAVKEVSARSLSRAGHLTPGDAPQDWEAEAAALAKLSNIRHENLIQCIAIISREDKYLFLFPWADGGNLRDWWGRLPDPKLTPEFVKEVLVQLHGLADALHTLHSYKSNAAIFMQGGRPGNDDVFTIEGGGIRHGDLKPENILRFATGDNDIGVLKIGDMGLAKHHGVNTRLRNNVTSTKYRTARYEPPEVAVSPLSSPATSRLYDVWSMGCIILECLIWLVWGNKELAAFNYTIQGSGSLGMEHPYYVIKRESGKETTAEVHPMVTRYIEALAADSACGADTALGDLLDIIRTKLLVVPLPPSGAALPDKLTSFAPASQAETNRGCYRASARSLAESLAYILDKGKANDGYWLTAPRRTRTPNFFRSRPMYPGSTSAVPVNPGDGVLLADSPPTAAIPMRETYFDLNKTHPLDITLWEHHIDNHFAMKLLRSLKGSASLKPPIFPEAGQPDRLCERCMNLDLGAPAFYWLDKLADLRESAKLCRFCRMRWDASGHLIPETDIVRFDRVGSVVKMNENDPPVFSLCRSESTLDSDSSMSVPIGLPVLPGAGSATHFDLIRLWLEDCDSEHFVYRCTGQPTGHAVPQAAGAGGSAYDSSNLELAILSEMRFRRRPSLPTRLINVGPSGSPSVRLYETQSSDRPEDFRYIALSHRWGTPSPEKPFFGTTVHNKEAHMSGMEINRLPDTFRDAVVATRALGLRYLWIDSICIIQGENGDFRRECKRMEDVFSDAYCVVAATCAAGPWDGFLKTDRPQREYLTLLREPGSSPIYVCRYLDDFYREVLQADMNRRGWVLQERALARRTIYFTRLQTFFECGAGVRCETLTRMSNKLAAFLGDPNFPEIAVFSHGSRRETSRAERILYFQDLYMTYSRLQFTHWEDRAVAMAGLEQRLSRGFNCRGKFGILADSQGSLLHRSLLWHRGVDERSLERIHFPPDRQKAPSWSWMAYRGGIDYFKIPFGSIEWESDSIRSLWQSVNVRTASNWEDEVAELDATAHEFIHGQAVLAEDFTIVYDVTGLTGGAIRDTLCVVLGKEKRNCAVRVKIHYVLLVAPTVGVSARTANAYTRVGAGRVPGRLINFEKPSLDIRVQ
ncbi:uncharacterized protein B0T15DRAFT_513341 [Chaetomium strumarium]|uniref:Protein kinase domain-containing protein n=1 Tax=Chaetomium strumarium TaxID=1170767 RepID=A0AAJ0GNE2_9PEZI|nr:hypothetical protein B0T15DRAFT_513341 [Chaetomium strumarium]